ncbi:hypothetical protein F5B20DRAFT_305986 [Whalleya microplaca]|nr:hypothetical protein F5B20DRAFT_305986 [Whalleya microplaca]
MPYILASLIGYHLQHPTYFYNMSTSKITPFDTTRLNEEVNKYIQSVGLGEFRKFVDERVDNALEAFVRELTAIETDGRSKMGEFYARRLSPTLGESTTDSAWRIMYEVLDGREVLSSSGRRLVLQCKNSSSLEKSNTTTQQTQNCATAAFTFSTPTSAQPPPKPSTSASSPQVKLPQKREGHATNESHNKRTKPVHTIPHKQTPYRETDVGNSWNKAAAMQTARATESDHLRIVPYSGSESNATVRFYKSPTDRKLHKGKQVDRTNAARKSTLGIAQ